MDRKAKWPNLRAGAGEPICPGRLEELRVSATSVEAVAADMAASCSRDAIHDWIKAGAEELCQRIRLYAVATSEHTANIVVSIED